MVWGIVIRLNNKEFIMVSASPIRRGQDKDVDCGIHKYNIFTNKWETIMKYPEDPYIDRNWTCVLDDDKNKVYMMEDPFDCNLVIIDLNNKKIENLGLKSLGEYGKSFASIFCKFVIVKNKLHSIGGCQVHLILDLDTNVIKKVENHAFGDNVLWETSVIYVKSKQCIVLIGGHIDGPCGDYIGIWIYSLINNWWNKVKQLTFNYHDITSLALTNDEKYIIISGGCYQGLVRQSLAQGISREQFEFMDRSETKKASKIHILDITNDDYNKWILYQSNINYPFEANGYHKTICMSSSGHLKERDKVLINGWIRTQILNVKEIKNDDNDNYNLMKMDKNIIDLISLWFSQDVFHYLRCYGDDEETHNHYSIKVVDVLSA